MMCLMGPFYIKYYKRISHLSHRFIRAYRKRVRESSYRIALNRFEREE